jgi:chromosome segregation ATPase
MNKGYLNKSTYFLLALVGAGVALGIGISRWSKPASLKSVAYAQERRVPVPANRGPSSSAEAPGPVRLQQTAKSISKIGEYVKDINEKNDFLKEKVAFLGEMLTAKEKEVTAIAEKLEKESREHAALKAKFDLDLKHYEASSSLKDSEIKSLQISRKEAEERLRQLDSRLAELTASQNTLSTQLVSAQLDRTSMDKELAKVKEELQQQTVLNSALNKSIVKLTADLEAKEKERLMVVDELEKSKAFRKHLEEEYAKLASLKGQYQHLNQGLEQRTRSLQKKLSAVTEDKQSLETQLSVLRQEKDSLDSQLRTLREDLRSGSSQKDSLSQSLTALTNDLRSKEQQLKELSAALVEVRSQKREVESGLSKSLMENSDLQDQVTRLNAQIKELSFSYEEAKKSYAALSERSSKSEMTLDRELNDQQEELAQARAALAKANQEKDALLSQVSEKERQISDMGATISAMQSQIEALQKEMVAYKQRQADALSRADLKPRESRRTDPPVKPGRSKNIAQLGSVLNNLESQMSGFQKRLSEYKDRQRESARKAAALQGRQREANAQALRRAQQDPVRETVEFLPVPEPAGEPSRAPEPLRVPEPSPLPEASPYPEEVTTLLPAYEQSSGTAVEDKAQMDDLEQTIRSLEEQAKTLENDLIDYAQIAGSSPDQGSAEAKEVNDALRALKEKLKDTYFELEMLRAQKKTRDN